MVKGAYRNHRAVIPVPQLLSVATYQASRCDELELRNENIKKLIGLFAVGAFVVWALVYPSAVSATFRAMMAVLTPFILGFAIAFIVNLLLRPVEHGWDRIFRTKSGGKKPGRRWLHTLRRPVCIVLSMVIIVGVLFVLMFMVVPEIVRTIALVVEMLPQVVERVQTWYSDFSDVLLEEGLVLPDFDLDTSELGEMASEWWAERGSGLLGRTVAVTTSIFSGAVNIVLGFIFALLLLSQKEQLGRQMRRTIQAFVPEAKAKRVFEIAELSNRTFAKFVTGQLTECVIIGVLCYIGMLVLSMPHAAAISVLIGATALIPVVGPIVGAAIGALLIVVVNPMKALWFIVFIIVLQQFEENVIYPVVVGKSVGLPGIWLMAAITIGGSTFGILGILLSVPVFSVLYTLLREAVNRRLEGKAPHHRRDVPS